jgi:hypothetical protein
MDVQETEGSFKCQKYSNCSKSFLSNNLLKIHIQMSHLGNKNIACPYHQCKYKPAQGYNVIKHILRIHEQFKKFKCKVCIFESFSNETTRNHIFHKHAYNDKFNKPRVKQNSNGKHTNDGKGKRKSGPTRYVRKNVQRDKQNLSGTLHLAKTKSSKDTNKRIKRSKLPIREIKENLVRCSNCTETFMTKEMLQVHEEGIHLGKKPTCPICKMQYRRVSSTIDHIKRVHEKINRHGDDIEIRQSKGKEMLQIELPLNVERIETAQT